MAGKPRFRKRKKMNPFAGDNMKKINYKNVEVLRKCVTDRGKILPRRVLGTTAVAQRKVTIEIKRARQLALLPYTAE